jgi:hypothetical protein
MAIIPLSSLKLHLKLWDLGRNCHRRGILMGLGWTDILHQVNQVWGHFSYFWVCSWFIPKTQVPFPLRFRLFWDIHERFPDFPAIGSSSLGNVVEYHHFEPPNFESLTEGAPKDRCRSIRCCERLERRRRRPGTSGHISGQIITTSRRDRAL